MDIAAPGQTSVGKSLALPPPLPPDGCFLHPLFFSSWSPLATGFSVNAGHFIWTLGPSANLSPAAKALTDTPPVVPARMVGLDLGPACGQCGGMMQRTGSCYTCGSCGNNTGCG